MSDRPDVHPGPISGNGCILGVEPNGDGWEISFASEPRTSPQPLWFHIEATGLGGAPVSFVWANPDICLGNSREIGRLRPVLRADGGDWRRCNQATVEQHEDGRRSLRFSHHGGADVVAAAFCFPYAPEHLDKTLSGTGETWDRCVIGVSTEGRPLERLRLTGDRPERELGLYLLARQHAGETSGSWVLDGILRFLAGDDDAAGAIREAVDVWVCPFVDLDGVVNGNYGKDALPWDFNRAWEQMPMRATVHAIQRDLLRFKDRTQPRLVIDLHAPGHSTPGVYVQLPREQRPEEQYRAARSFARTLAGQFPELPPDEIAHDTRYASRWNMLSTVGSWVWDNLDQTPCVAVETSYQRLAEDLLYPEDYRDIGCQVMRAAATWLLRRGE